MATANTVPGIIRDRIRAAGGSLPWAEVMRLALYEPGAGYYRRGVRRIGRRGDFYTSVSVGPVFGELLGRFIQGAWGAAGSPREFGIIEQGAHDGTLAADILLELKEQAPELFEAARYHIVEPDAVHQTAQRTTLGGMADKLVHAARLAELRDLPEHAIFLCNELPDAMPVHRMKLAPDGWKEYHVRCRDEEHFEFVLDGISSERLAAELDRIGVVLPEGFVTEVNLAMLDWVRELAAVPFRGPALILDYGHNAEDYFSPERHEGSLRRYGAHRADDRVLENLGECDLTAHVNFTRLAKEAEDLGLFIAEFIEQGRFLCRLAPGPRPGTPEKSAAWLRQFHSLTHPGLMGRSFHALLLGKDFDSSGLITPAMTATARRRLGL